MRQRRLSGLKARLRQLLYASEGQDLIEYGALIAIIATTVLIAVTELGAKVPAMYSTTEASMPGNPGSGNPGNGNPGNNNPGGGNPGNNNPGGGNGNGNPGGNNPGGGNPGGGNPGN